MLYKVGIDLGGTKTEIIVLDENLNVLERKRVVTPQNNYDEIINTIETLVLDVSKNISDFSLGICCPGALSKQTGLIKNSNTQCLIGKSLKKDLELRNSIQLELLSNKFNKPNKSIPNDLESLLLHFINHFSIKDEKDIHKKLWKRIEKCIEILI